LRANCVEQVSTRNAECRYATKNRQMYDFLDIVKGNGYSSVLSGAMFSFFILE
jgi:hypothetical protein